MGNSILNDLLAKFQNSEYYTSIDRVKCNTLPEIIKMQETNINISAPDAYKNFYFTRGEDNSEYAIQDSKGLISLHNSWTPLEYKIITREEFLNQDITLAKLLKKLLEI